MKRHTLLGLTLAMIVLLVVAGVAFAAYSMGQAQAANNSATYGPGRGMGRGMMGNQNSQPGGFASPDQTAPAAPSTAPAAPSSGVSSANASTQKAGTWNVTLALTPYPPVSFQQTTFDIAITDEKGNAVSDAKVSLDLTMPSMWMPDNQPPTQSLGSGKYRALGRFTMRGDWQIAVIIERGSEKQTAYFKLWL
ncbi:MAG: FixH family protein [Chloroflexi bacterium]|nr:FixH family protein [Chloroflexota bacterium]